MPPNHEKPQNKKGSYFRNYLIQRAENGTQTRDPQLGRLVLYQLSYFRMSFFLLRCKGSDFTVANQIFPYIFLLLPCFCIKNPEREVPSLSGSVFLRTSCRNTEAASFSLESSPGLPFPERNAACSSGKACNRCSG